MKRLIATTAIALMMSTSAFAQSTMQQVPTYQTQSATDIFASNLIGQRVYATEQPEYSEWNMETMIDGNSRQEWEDIGEVNDVILSRDGKVQAVILGIGGFLGLGERDVAIEMSGLKFVRDGENANDYFLVTKTNKAMLEQAEPFERSAAATGRETMDNSATGSVNRMDGDRRMLVRPEVERDGFVQAEPEQLTAETLTGARVYGVNDEDVGEVGEILLTDDGKIDRLVLDIGGFLGLGEHNVAVTLDELNIQRDENGSLRIFIDATLEQLEAQPEYRRS